MRLFHEKSSIGHYSGSRRDFEDEYSSVEEEKIPNDALYWLEKGRTAKYRKQLEEKWRRSLELLESGAGLKGTNYTVGHSHIDLAWLWRYLQTVEKVRVTLTKACIHIERIPEFTFAASQAAIFDWCMRRYPDLFQRVKDVMKTGRFELVGGSWCEPDGRMPSGEAWARQRLYGQLFYKKHFGTYASIALLPDSFGFSSSLPQIFARSNARYFHTNKLASNLVNPFLFSTFWWASPDGSRVLAESVVGSASRVKQRTLKKALLSSDAAREPTVFNYETSDIEECEPHFSDDRIPYAFTRYGKGDGGHGPTGEEVQERLFLHEKKLIKLSLAREYFERVEKEYSARLPVWMDELYLEWHRGTLTSQSLVKRMNRYNEWILPALEMVCTLASLNSGFTYPLEAIEESWKITLLQQFHDVMSGCCIPEVYDDSWDLWCWQVETHARIKESAFEPLEGVLKYDSAPVVREKLSGASRVIPVIYFNPTSFRQETVVELPARLLGGFVPTSVVLPDGSVRGVSLLPGIKCPGEPLYDLQDRVAFMLESEPFSFSTLYFTDIKPGTSSDVDGSLTVESNGNFIEVSNGLLKFRVDKTTGAITSMQIKSAAGGFQETLVQGPKKFADGIPELEPGIKLHAFLDQPSEYPTWNIWDKLRLHPLGSDTRSVRVLEKTDNHVTIETEVRYLTPNPEKSGATDETTVVTWYTLYRGDPMLRVTMQFDFHAKMVTMKLDIPTATGAERIETETAFGINSRSTHPRTARDKERWENFMHTWANVQTKDGLWGFAIINNGKYGLDYRGGYVGISVIRGQAYNPASLESWVYKERFRRLDEGLGYQPSWIDQGHHVIQLVLYPHPGSIYDAGVIPRAHLFNVEPMCYKPKSDNSAKNLQFSTNALDRAFPKSSPPIEILAVKHAHPDGERTGFTGDKFTTKHVIIVRAFNSSRADVESTIDVEPLKPVMAVECDLLERRIDGSFTTKKNDGI
ncbi:MAG: glycoside hydrolase family 38 C-terminal domain-containing protein, partial [Promethearchaeota archaeon]